MARDASSQMQNTIGQYANHSRLVSMTYPNGRVVSDNYAAGLDDALSRLTSLSDSSGVLEAYAYLGLDTVVQRVRPQPGQELTYVKLPAEPTGDAGDQYTGLDRFGRVVDQRWLATGSGASFDEFQYGYDADGNVLYRANPVAAAAQQPFGELYRYDGLNRLATFSRGQLNTTHNGFVGLPTRAQSWTLDALGNWLTVSSSPGGPTQARTFNSQNQISAISGAGTPATTPTGTRPPTRTVRATATTPGTGWSARPPRRGRSATSTTPWAGRWSRPGPGPAR